MTRTVGSVTRYPILCATLALLSLPTTVLAQTVVNTCGQLVGGSAVLAADLDCSGHPDAAVVLKKGAKLDLAGFTLTGGDAEGVLCERGCSVFSSTSTRGSIVGAGTHGIANPLGVFPPAKISVENVRFEANGSAAAIARSTLKSTLKVKNCLVENGGGSLGAIHRVSVVDTIMTDSGGIGGGDSSTRVRRVSVDGSEGYGLSVSGFNCRDSTFTNSTWHGISAFLQGDVGYRGRMKNCSATGGLQDGLHVRTLSFGKLSIRGGTFSGNLDNGIFIDDGFSDGGAVRISDATISDNGGSGITSGDTRDLDQLALKNTAIERNAGHGIAGRFDKKGISLVSTTVADNGLNGILHTANGLVTADTCAVRIVKSTISGNGTDGQCGVAIPCAGVSACNPPELLSGSCDSDHDSESGLPGSAWGICGP